MKKNLFLTALMAMPFFTGAFGQNVVIETTSTGASTTGTNNTNLGTSAGASSTGSAAQNVYVGHQAGFTNTSGSDNTGVGFRALFLNTTGYQNSAFGKWSMNNNTTGYQNSAFGQWSLTNNTTGYQNTALGTSALSENTTGIRNTAVGIQALFQNSSGGSNSAFGLSCMSNNTTGGSNTVMGAYAMNNTNSSLNTVIGANAFFDNTSGSSNTGLGYNTGRGITTGSNNTIIGANVTGLNPALSNNIIIADGAGNRRINVDNNGNVGIGTNTPATTSLLDLTSTSKGFLLPRMTTTQRNAIASPATGLQIYNTTTKAINYYDGTKWREPSNWNRLDFGSGIGTYFPFTDNDNVIIGFTPTISTPIYAKLHVDVPLATPMDAAIYGVNNTLYNTSRGVWGQAFRDNVGIGGDFEGGKIGARGTYWNGPSSTLNVSGNRYGMYGLAQNDKWDNTNISAMVGVYGEGSQWAENGDAYGVYGATTGSICGSSYGVYGTVNGFCWQSWAGYFNGDVFRSGTDNFTSDRKLKKNIEPMASAMSQIMKLKPSTYEFRKDEFTQMNLPKGTRYGFIAQDLEEIFPTLVKETHHPAQMDKDGNIISEAVDFKSVSYTELIPVLTKAIQEQQQMIDELTKKVAAATEVNKTVATIQGTTTQKVDINKTALLFQNHPNPFQGVTFIEYFLPETSNNAFVRVVDNNGKLVQAFAIDQTGFGQIELNCANLAQGTYHYTLMVDSKVVDTKTLLITAGK